MNRNENRSEDEIIKLLRQMPPVHDERSMEEIYSLVQDKVNKTNGSTRHKSIKKFNVWPILASAAALFLAVLVGINLDKPKELSTDLANQTDMDQGIMEKAPINRDTNNIAKIPPETEMGITGFVGGGDTADNTGIIYFDNVDARALYSEQGKEDQVVVTLGIPEPDAYFTVPITIKVNNSNNWFEYYTKIMEEIDETQLSLTDYYPYNGALSLENNILKLDLNENHTYDMGSRSEILFFDSLYSLRYQNVEIVNLYETSEPGVYFSHIGDVIHEVPISKFQKHGYWLYISASQSYMVSVDKDFNTVDEAFLEMKNPQEGNLLPTIPNHIQYEVIDNKNGNLVFRFDGNTQLSSDIDAIRMIEAILLTAKDFGFSTVQFENTGVEQIDRYNFSSPIEVPLAPNLVGEIN